MALVAKNTPVAVASLAGGKTNEAPTEEWRAKTKHSKRY